MKEKRLSIVIPTIGRQILDKTIESALAQTVTPYELVVWDNSGSGSAKASSKYATDPRIRWEVSGTKYPIIESWNNAVNRLTGEYVYILGDDDLLLPEFVSEVQSALDAGAELVHTTAQLIDSEGNVTKTETVPAEESYEIETKNFLTDYIQKNAYHISLGSLVFPLKKFREIGAFKSIVMNALSMDILFNIEMFSVIEKITILAKPVWQYRFGVSDWCGALKNDGEIQLLFQQYFELSRYAKKYFTGDLFLLYEMFHRKQILSSIVRFSWMRSPFKTILLCFKKGLRFKDRYLMFRDILYMVRQ